MHIGRIIAGLSVDEKAALSTGADFWNVSGNDRAGIPAVRVTDGPNGARGSALLGAGTVTSVCVPCGSALGATWDAALVQEVGALLGREARTKSARVLLAPTINLHRSPLGGRGFECYSEDPLLTGTIAAGFIRGVQSQGVAATAKHFVGNEAEFERNTISSDIGERALRELYLRPFEMAVKQGGVWAIMTAYNRLNGTFCTEDRMLLTDILRDEWGFDGVVMTDWFGVAATETSAAAGLDLEMPGPGRAYGSALAAAVHDGRVAESVLDESVHRWLTLIDRVGAWHDPRPVETSVDAPPDRALARRAATDSMVLLHNNGVLPLDATATRSVALIGPNAASAHIMGGGSAQLAPHYRVTLLEILGDRLGDRLTFEPGCAIDKSTPALGGPALRTASGERGMDVEFWAGHLRAGAPAHTTVHPDGRLVFFENPVPGIVGGEFSFRATGRFIADRTGVHTVTLAQMGRATVHVDGRLVLDGVSTPLGGGDQFFGLASEEIEAEVALSADQSIDVVVDYESVDGLLFYGAKVGLRRPVTSHELEDAVQAATRSDVAIVMVGTSDEWETEGRDRQSMDLPGAQDELIRRVAAVNNNTIVLVNTGAPVTMPWADDVAAIVQVWLGGQEMAAAVDAVLFGDAEPAGRLPVTLPLRLEHNPTHGSFPGENGHVVYGEGLLVGYRWYDTHRLPTRFSFGHGGSYTRFTWGTASLSAAELPIGGEVVVEVPVCNVGDRRGAEVVQCYVQPAPGEFLRPNRELIGWRKVWLDPGQSEIVRITLGERAFAAWEPIRADPDHRSGWWISEGSQHIDVAASVVDVRQTLVLGTVRRPADQSTPRRRNGHLRSRE